MKNSGSKRAEKQERLAAKLPLKITSISPQKKRGDRFSLFNDGDFLMGVSSQVLLDFSLKKGVELTPFLFRQIIEAEEYQKVKEKCYDLLSRRDHASFELKRKVSKKDYSPEVIDEVIAELEDKDLIDNQKFAVSFAKDKAEFKRWGPQKIISELIKKGIDPKTANIVVENQNQHLELDEICVDLALKKRRHFLREEDLFKRKQKIYRYLMGKGYQNNVIKTALPTILKKLHA